MNGDFLCSEELGGTTATPQPSVRTHPAPKTLILSYAQGYFPEPSLLPLPKLVLPSDSLHSFSLIYSLPDTGVFTDMDPGQEAGMATYEQFCFLFLAQMGLHGSPGSRALRHEAVPGVCLAPVCLST